MRPLRRFMRSTVLLSCIWSAALNSPILISFNFEIHVKLQLVYRCFIFQLNEMEVCLNGIHFGVYLWETEWNGTYTLSLRLE
jgi:hypothetical protein